MFINVDKIILKDTSELKFEYRNTECVIIKNETPTQKWYCGYVRTKEGNKYHCVDYTSLENINCHRGLTFSGQLDDFDGWYIGFDCMHAGDNIKKQNLDYCIEQCKKIVDQLI